MNKFYLIILLFISFSCLNKPNKNTNNQIIATIGDSVEISYSEIDNLMSQKLYDELNEIYYIRKVALDRVLRNKLIEIEAKEIGISKEEYLEKNINSMLTEENVTLFATKNNLLYNLPKVDGKFLNYNKSEESTKKLLFGYYYEYLFGQLTDSLIQKHNVTINLAPPKSPKINLSDNVAYFKGNLESNITLWIVSDFTCNVCNEIAPKYNELIKKFEDKIRIGYIPYSSEVNSLMILAHYAYENNLFWEFWELMKADKNQIKEDDILVSLGLNEESAYDVLSDSVIYYTLKNNIENLNNKGFYGTPTLILNNEFIDPFDIKSAENLIENKIGI